MHVNIFTFILNYYSKTVTSCILEFRYMVLSFQPPYLTLNCLIQVEKAQSGLKSLSFSQKTTTMLKENFIEIEKYEDDRLYNTMQKSSCHALTY